MKKNTQVHRQNAIFQLKLKVSTMFITGDKKIITFKPEMTPVTSFDLWSTYKAEPACKLSRRFTYMSYMTTALIISEK